jgi:hypothetical protein
MAVISNQRTHLLEYRRLCENQKATIKKLSLVNDRQHELLVMHGMFAAGITEV